MRSQGRQGARRQPRHRNASRKPPAVRRLSCPCLCLCPCLCPCLCSRRHCASMRMHAPLSDAARAVPAPPFLRARLASSPHSCSACRRCPAPRELLACAQELENKVSPSRDLSGRQAASGGPAADPWRERAARPAPWQREVFCDTSFLILRHIRLGFVPPRAQSATQISPESARAGSAARARTGPGRYRAGTGQVPSRDRSGQGRGRASSETGAGRTLLRRRPVHRLTRRAGVPSCAELRVRPRARCLRITPAVRSRGALRRVLGAPLAR